MEDERSTFKVSVEIVFKVIHHKFSCLFRLLYGPKINIEDEDIKKGSIPEWKLQPKVSYDDDEGDD